MITNTLRCGVCRPRKMGAPRRCIGKGPRDKGREGLELVIECILGFGISNITYVFVHTLT